MVTKDYNQGTRSLLSSALALVIISFSWPCKVGITTPVL